MAGRTPRRRSTRVRLAASLVAMACALLGVVGPAAIAGEAKPAFAQQGACGDRPCGEVPGNPGPCGDAPCGAVDGGAGPCGDRPCGPVGGTQGPCGDRPCEHAPVNPTPCQGAGCGGAPAGQSPNQATATTTTLPAVTNPASPPQETDGGTTTTTAAGFIPGQAAPELDLAKDSGSDRPGWIIPLALVGLVAAVVVWLTRRHRGGQDVAP